METEALHGRSNGWRKDNTHGEYPNELKHLKLGVVV